MSEAVAQEETPLIFLPYQAKIAADESQIKIIEKSRRIGVSWGIAAECTVDAAESDGCDTWYLGYNKEMSQEFIRDCAEWARKFGTVISTIEEEEIFEDGDEAKGILTYTIRFASGYRISALSSRPTNLRNKKGHIVIDEAAYHEDLPGLLKAAIAVLIWGGRARITIISTHNGVDNEFNKVIADCRAGKLPYSVHRITIDDALADGFFKRICLVNDWVWSAKREAAWRKNLFRQYGSAADEELLCVPSKSGGVYIVRPLIERQMIDGLVRRLTLDDAFVIKPENYRKAYISEWCEENLLNVLDALPKDLHHFFGQDFGRVSDRSVITPGYLTIDLRRRFPFAVEMLNVPFDAQQQILFYLVDRLPKFFFGALDATGNGSSHAEAALQKYGEKHIECIAMTEKWYTENLPPLKAAFEDETIFIVRDADHLVDMSAFKVINGLPKLPKAKTKSKSEGPPRHGDAAIAYLVAYYASKQPLAVYGGYQAAKVDKTAKAGFAKNRGAKRGVM